MTDLQKRLQRAVLKWERIRGLSVIPSVVDILKILDRELAREEKTFPKRRAAIGIHRSRQILRVLRKVVEGK